LRTDLVPAAEALSIILEGARPYATNTVSLAQAQGRILAADIAALRTQPPFRASAMDGYALRATDVAAAPATLTPSARCTSPATPPGLVSADHIIKT
jgi:molybdopterin molybdotransferase